MTFKPDSIRCENVTVRNLWIISFFSTLVGLPFIASGADNPDIDQFTNLNLGPDIVLTPTRLKQNRRDVPASVTVITEEMIKDLGIQNIPEALRLVPGMAVARQSGNIYRIEYHGTNGLIPRRMQILIDGVSYYRAGIALVLWKELPVSIHDVERIEITRSPSSAAYGANSFIAVVNIITKHPTDVIGKRFDTTAGSLDTRNAFFSHGGIVDKDTHQRISISHREDTGFDINNTGGEKIDSTFVDAVDYRRYSMLGNNIELDLVANFMASSESDDAGDPNQISNPKFSMYDRNISMKLSSQITNMNQLITKVYFNHFNRDHAWNTCYPQVMFSDELRALHLAYPELADQVVKGGTPAGDTPEETALLNAVYALPAQALTSVCGQINDNYDEKRVGYELQDTHVFSEQLRIVAGLGLTRTIAKSETLLGDELLIDSQYLFANAEYRPTSNITINLGSMWENEEHHTDGYEYSPRAALNYHIVHNHTLRFIYAEAVRTPDLLESDRNWNYTMSGMTPPLYNGNTEALFYYNAKAMVDLNSEKIRAKEISYYGRSDKHNLSWDVKLFREDLTNLISEKLIFFDFFPSNNNAARLQGLEVQIEYQADPISGYFAYAYLDNEATTELEKTLYSRHSGSGSVSYRINKKWSSSLAYYGSESIGGYSYDRVDWLLARHAQINDNIFSLQFQVQYYGNKTNGFIDDINSVRTNTFKDDTHYFVTLSWRN